MSIYFLIDSHFSFDYIINIMPTDKPKILLTIDKDLLEKVEDFRFENRINTRSEAIRRLLKEGLTKYQKKAKK